MTQTATWPNRNDRQPDDILCKKKDLATRFGCSVRQIELMSNDGRLPRPFYIGDASPRWRRADIDAWLERLATKAQAEVLAVTSGQESRTQPNGFVQRVN